MNLMKNWKFIGLLIVVLMLSVLDLLKANNDAARFWVQSYLWKAPSVIKAVINTEIGKPYTVTKVDDNSSNGKIDELKALKFWFDFEIGDEFIATSTVNNQSKSLYFVSLRGVVGSYHRNLLEYASPSIKESCYFGFPNKLVSIDKDGVQEKFLLILNDLYVFNFSDLSSIDISEKPQRCNN